jgi:hypothetical protein
MGMVESRKIPRVPGTAVFLTRTSSGTLPAMTGTPRTNGLAHLSFRPQGRDGFDPLDQRARASVRDRTRTQLLARDGAIWIHAKARHSCHIKTSARAGLRSRSRRRHLLRLARNNRSPRGREGSCQIGGGSLCRDGAKRRARKRFLWASERPCGRTRPLVESNIRNVRPTG